MLRLAPEGMVCIWTAWLVPESAKSSVGSLRAERGAERGATAERLRSEERSPAETVGHSGRRPEGLSAEMRPTLKEKKEHVRTS